MFYRIRDEKLYDYADGKYAEDCLQTNIISQAELDDDRRKVIVEDGVLVLNPEYDNIKKTDREAEFNANFFNTSLGYIRRKVTMKDGSKKDFLSDLLLSIKAGLEIGQDVEIICYYKPSFDVDVTDWTIYQHIEHATPQFISECLQQTVKDFKGE